MVNKKVLCVHFKCCARQYSIYMLSKTVFQQVLNLNTPERRGNLPYSPLVSAGFFKKKLFGLKSFRPFFMNVTWEHWQTVCRQVLLWNVFRQSREAIFNVVNDLRGSECVKPDRLWVLYMYE